MFVSSATHNAVVRQANANISYLTREYRDLLSKWNKLVDRINKHGGEAIFDRVEKTTPQFTAEEVRSLIQLVHPDRHGGKESAVRMTRKLIELRESL
jgi:hypothetical protein